MKNKKIAQLALVSTLVLLLSACTFVINQESNSDTDAHDSHSMGDSMDNSEAMFAEMMIPHHQQAILMSEIALAKSSNPEVLDLAKQIIAAQSVEITLMESWVEDMDHGSHGNHSMSGMATEEELTRLDSLSSPEFDELFLTLMIAHHEGALDMVSMLDGTTNPEAKKLAEDIVRVQDQEIELMKKLLESIKS